MSSGETPPAPRITEGVSGRWSDLGMPSLYAIAATFSAPMSIASRAYTAFTDCSSAVESGSTAELAGSAFCTVQKSSGALAPGKSG